MAQSPIVTLRGQPHSPVVVGQRHVVKQLQTGVCNGHCVFFGSMWKLFAPVS